MSNETSELRVLLPKISGDVNLVWLGLESNASKKDSKYVWSDCFCSSSASSRAFKNFVLEEFSARPFNRSLIENQMFPLTLKGLEDGMSFLTK